MFSLGAGGILSRNRVMDKGSRSVLRIQLKKVNKSYPGIHALKNFNFELAAGEVHCLCGENGSGKSTFIKIISGVETPDLGAEIWIDGVHRVHHSASSAISNGIQVIYQDMSLFPNLTVCENITFSQMMASKGLVSRKKLESIAYAALAELGISMDLDRKVETLSVAQQQLVEICRALTSNLQLLILDEPTASLTRKEVNALFLSLARLKKKGISILFVSHKLGEVFEIAERITVIRDGEKIGVFDPNELNSDQLIFHMTGQVQASLPPSILPAENPPALEVRNLCRRAEYQDISFTLKKGEILGITGLLGSGRTELALSLFGMSRPDSGAILVASEVMTFKSNRDAIRAGIAYVSENRRDVGLLLEQSILDNLSITVLDKFLNKFRFLSEKKRRIFSEQGAKNLGVKTSSIDVLAGTLSGGNQQKVVLSKWLNVAPKILILDEPTIGIDVVAKNSIHTLIKHLAEEGMSIIMISDEVAEVMRNCLRVLVMQEGRIVHDFSPRTDDAAREEKLLSEFNLA